MPLLAAVVGRLLQPFFRFFLGLEGRLAGDNLVRSPGRTGLVIAALAATGCLVLGTAGFTYSTERAINHWIDDNIAADLYVTAGSGISKAGFALPMDESVGVELAHNERRRGRPAGALSLFHLSQSVCFPNRHRRTRVRGDRKGRAPGAEPEPLPLAAQVGSPTAMRRRV